VVEPPPERSLESVRTSHWRSLPGGDLGGPSLPLSGRVLGGLGATPFKAVSCSSPRRADASCRTRGRQKPQGAAQRCLRPAPFVEEPVERDPTDGPPRRALETDAVGPFFRSSVLSVFRFVGRPQPHPGPVQDRNDPLFRGRCPRGPWKRGKGPWQRTPSRSVEKRRPTVLPGP